MNREPLVSVLIPAYNVGEYIEDSLNSILEQSYKNIEVIVVDDCSNDQTYSILMRMQQKDSRINVYKNEKNLKIAKTLNFGLEQCKGEYILRMDGDDVSHKLRIEIMLKYLLENDEISLVGSGFYSIDENGNKLASYTYPKQLWKINKCLKYGPPVLHIWLAKTEVYQKLNGYRDISGAEDYDFLLRLKTNNLKFTNIDDKLYSIRLRNGNSLSTMGYEQRLLSMYVYKLFLERKKYSSDSYSGNLDNIGYDIKECNDFKYSINNLKKAIMYKNEKQYFKMLINLARAILSSRVQRLYIFNRVKFKIINML